MPPALVLALAKGRCLAHESAGAGGIVDRILASCSGDLPASHIPWIVAAIGRLCEIRKNVTPSHSDRRRQLRAPGCGDRPRSGYPIPRLGACLGMRREPFGTRLPPILLAYSGVASSPAAGRRSRELSGMGRAVRSGGQGIRKRTRPRRAGRRPPSLRTGGRPWQPRLRRPRSTRAIDGPIPGVRPELIPMTRDSLT